MNVRYFRFRAWKVRSTTCVIFLFQFAIKTSLRRKLPAKFWKTVLVRYLFFAHMKILRSKMCVPWPLRKNISFFLRNNKWCSAITKSDFLLTKKYFVITKYRFLRNYIIEEVILLNTEASRFHGIIFCHYEIKFCFANDDINKRNFVIAPSLTVSDKTTFTWLVYINLSKKVTTWKEQKWPQGKNIHFFPIYS